MVKDGEGGNLPSELTTEILCRTTIFNIKEPVEVVRGQKYGHKIPSMFVEHFNIKITTQKW